MTLHLKRDTILKANLRGGFYEEKEQSEELNVYSISIF